MRAQSVSAAVERARVARRDRGLQRVRPQRSAERFGARQRGEAAADEELVPARAVLVEQQDGLALASTRAGSRDAWISISATRPCTSDSSVASSARMRPRRSASSHSAGRVQCSPDGRGVAFVEDEVEHLEHRRRAVRALVRPRDLERHACLGQRALGAHDALRDGGLRHQEGARDLVGGQAAQEPQREGDARLRREHRMTGDEHEAQEIVARCRRAGSHRRAAALPRAAPRSRA
jgi:hypothetical protein